jgi:uncharacterized protein YebE (UPF0316 family)
MDYVSLIVIPLLIFVARIFDVTLGTIRIILVSRGVKIPAALLGFFEVLIWLIAIGRVMQNLNNVSNYIAYAGGFAMGNFVGIYIEGKLAMGFLSIRIVTAKDAAALIDYLKSEDVGATSVAARGVSGEVRIVFTIIRRKELQDTLEIISKFNPGAFIAIEDVRSVSNDVFPSAKPKRVRLWKKGK